PRVGLHRRHAEGRRTRADITGQRLCLRGRLPVAVVFQQHEKRQPETHRKIEGLVNDAFAERPIADADRHHCAAPRELLGQRQACRDRNDSALDAVAEELPPAQVLASADATARTAALAHDFGNETLDVVRPGEIVAVAAVVREDDVAAAVQGACQRDGRELLADAGMSRPRELAGGEQLQETLLDDADQIRGRQPGMQRAALQDRFELTVHAQDSFSRTRESTTGMVDMSVASAPSKRMPNSRSSPIRNSMCCKEVQRGSCARSSLVLKARSRRKIPSNTRCTRAVTCASDCCSSLISPVSSVWLVRLPSSTCGLFERITEAYSTAVSAAATLEFVVQSTGGARSQQAP